MPTRRHFLRTAAGAALALPSLPSLGSAPTASAAPAQRFAVFYSPIGLMRRGFFPGEENAALLSASRPEELNLGKDYGNGSRPLQLTSTMEPLAGLQDRITLVTGLDRTFQDGTDVHAQCASCFLSSAAPYSIESSAWPLDRTLDHIIADHIGAATPYRSLEFSANSHKDNKESIYFDNISWYGTGHVAPSLRDPVKAYDRLFGTSSGDDLGEITSLALADANDLRRKLGQDDREKFEEYFQSVREIEQRIAKMQTFRAELEEAPLPVPTAALLPRGEYMSLMGDLMIAALQTGLTNVVTFMAGPERWDTPFTFEGLFDGPRSHHKMSHSPGKYEDDLRRLDLFHMEQYAALVRKMDAITESDGSSLLDHTTFTFGSGLGDGASHQYNDLPIIVAGGQEKRGQHHAAPDGTPLANLWLAQAQAFGIKRESFADSTAPLAV